MSDISNLIVVSRGGYPTEVSFSIHGAPPVQNGWKLAWKKNRRPVMYDPMQKEKIFLRADLRLSLFDLLGRSSFPIFGSRSIQVNVFFKLHNLHCKDIDNMMKFLFDAMQHVVYKNDSSIMTAIVHKVQAHDEEAESTFVKISLNDNNPIDV
jgi:Holliday junction resolvase RusA-like endonuclease